QLPVKSIKQAVLTYGIERVGDMLIQFALLERLTQNQFPLMGMCKQLTLLACSFASYFAQLADSKFSPQSAALTMTFVCTPLFTLPGFKVSRALPVDLSKAVSINSAFKVKSDTPWLAIASELAGSWHQSSTWRAVIHQCSKVSTDVPKSLQKEQAILVLSFAIAKACLFNQDIYSLLQDINIKTLLNILGIRRDDVVNALDANGSLLFCPLAQ
ncbi:MAG: histidine kinase, partial [Pseudomonadota bacterium]